MKDKPAPEGSRDNPWPTLLRILTRRDHSCAELRQRLIEKGFTEASVEAALLRGLELGYVDDRRYALARAASLMRQGRAVGHRILQDLRQRGISEDQATQALEQARAACDEEVLLAGLLARRFPEFHYHSAPARDKRRVINFLLRRGFTIGCVMDYLTRKGSATSDEDRQ